jgi:DNA-binding XRE family transcriptional regulator
VITAGLVPDGASWNNTIGGAVEKPVLLLLFAMELLMAACFESHALLSLCKMKSRNRPIQYQSQIRIKSTRSDQGYTPHVDLATKTASPKRTPQVEPTTGPKWAFGKVLRECRREKGLSQERLAATGGLDRSFLSMVERGSPEPQLGGALRNRRNLQVPASELIVRTETALGSTPHPSADH